MNFRGSRGLSASTSVCMYGKTESLRLLLKDPRLEFDSKALWCASRGGHLLAVKWLLASGKNVHADYEGVHGGRGYTPLQIAIEWKQPEVASLLGAYAVSPGTTTRRLRAELDIDEQDAADLFALCVFVSEGLLQVKPRHKETPEAKFFAVAIQLPCELQMILSLRTCNSSTNLVRTKYREEALNSCGQRGVLEDEWLEARYK